MRKGSRRERGDGERVERSNTNERTVMGVEREGEQDREEREIDNGYAMVFRFFTMFAPNARSRR